MKHIILSFALLLCASVYPMELKNTMITGARIGDLEAQPLTAITHDYRTESAQTTGPQPVAPHRIARSFDCTEALLGTLALTGIVVGTPTIFAALIWGASHF